MHKVTHEDLLELQDKMYEMSVPEELDRVFKHHSLSPHYRFLYLFTQKFKPEVIVELGTHWGTSSVAMARGNPKSIVYTVDIKKYDEHVNNDLNIKEYLGSSIDEGIVNKMPNDIELLFSDSGHSYELTMGEYCNYVTKMKQDGVIFVDDIEAAEGTKRFWDSLDRSKLVLEKVHPNHGFGAIIIK